MNDDPVNPGGSVEVRLAAPDDLPSVMNVLDGALLAIDAATVNERIDSGEVIVANANGAIRGALVFSGAEIEAIAVRRRHRVRGIGTALVERGRADREGELYAEFDPRVRPFYESLGFRIEPIGDGRLRGRDVAK